MKPLPLGIQTFEHFIEGDYLYVDKTAHIRELLRPLRGMYFLSRPRRFGKSLLVTTLKAIFEGKRELFEGLAIGESDYEWQEHPVIHIDMSRSPASSAKELDSMLTSQVNDIAARNGLELTNDGLPQLFDELIQRSPKETVSPSLSMNTTSPSSTTSAGQRHDRQLKTFWPASMASLNPWTRIFVLYC